MATQNSTTTTTPTEYEKVYGKPFHSKALEMSTANAKRAEAMIATLEEYGEPRWIGQRISDPWHLVHEVTNCSFVLSFTNDPYLFKSKMAVENLICREPIEAIDALTWYKQFLADCLETIEIFSR